MLRSRRPSGGIRCPPFKLTPNLLDPCWLCQVTVVHRETHEDEASPHHQELLRTVGPPNCVEAALRLLQRDRPDLLATAARELPDEGTTPAAAAAASTVTTAADVASDLLLHLLMPFPCPAEPLAASAH